MTESEIKQYLKTKIFGRKIYSFDVIDSTNTHLKSLTLEGAEEGTLVIAEQQTAGKGRLGRTWQTEKGMNLTFSILLKPTIKTEQLGIIPIAAGLAVAEAIQKTFNIRPDCKWPNDVLLEEKKVCGILSESVFSKNKLIGIIVGIGVNANQTDFPPELKNIATSIAVSIGATVNRVELLSTILERLEFWYNRIQSHHFEDVIKNWKLHSTMLGKRISVKQHDNILNGIAREIAVDGSLVVQTNGKEINVHSGDVTIIHS